MKPIWTISDLGPWQLIYNDSAIISLAPVEGITSTQGTLFVGTEAECRAEALRIGLPWAAEPANAIAEILPDPVLTSSEN